MAKVILPITNGFYRLDSLPLSAQECTNWYPVKLELPGLSAQALYGTPGAEQVATSGPFVTSANRGGLTFQDKPYFVNGEALYRLESDYTLSNLGVVEGTERVSMAVGSSQMMILVPGGKGYIFTTGPDSLVEITDTDFRANGDPQHVAFVDGYFVCTTDENKFIISALNDGADWNALDFGSAEALPDKMMAPAVFRNQLFITGESSVEGFNNQGGMSDFPFVRSGQFFERGVLAPHTLVNAYDAVYFIGSGAGESPAIWRYAGGSEAQKISTIAIESILQEFTEAEIAECFAWRYAQKGGYFVGFSLPTTCLVYEQVSGLWHERKSTITNPDLTVKTVRWRANCIVEAYGELFIGDSESGRIGRLDIDIYSEYGEAIQRTISTQPFQNNMESFFVASLELTIESGVGNPDSVDPVIAMARSLDGKTWTDETLRKMGMGEIGEYQKRVIWRRLGRAKRFETFRFRLSDPIKPVIMQLTADIRPGLK